MCVENVAERIIDFFEKKNQIMLFHEGEKSWRNDDLIRAITLIAKNKNIPAPGSKIAIQFRSPADLLISCFVAWSCKCLPVLIDPDSPMDRVTVNNLDENIFFMNELFSPEDNLVDREIMGAELLPEELITPVIPSGDEAFIGFLTSGSEGLPKIIIKKAYQLRRQVSVIPDFLPLKSPKIVCMVPPYHILGFMYGILLPLFSHAECWPTHQFMPNVSAEIITREKPGLVVGTAVQYRVLNTFWHPTVQLNETLFISSGSPLDKLVAAEFSEKVQSPIIEMYGSTETGGCAYRKGNSPWQPYPNVHFRINKSRNHLEIKSPWSKAPETWIDTHDLAESSDEGFQLLGREGSLVKIGGKRFATREVENVIREFPQVQDVAVIVQERPNNEAALFAFVEKLTYSQLKQDELRQFLVTKLPPFKVPRFIEIMDQLPRTKLSKIDFAQLRKKLKHLIQ